MEETKRELQAVTEELALIEEQLEVLLERQSELSNKKQRLQNTVKDLERTPSANQSKDWENTEFDWSKSLRDTRDAVFNIKQFRPLQLSTMNATLAKQDCLLIMPTGGGKSLCFQLPALVSKGITLVVSPLVSLMEDQLMSLHKQGVNATLLNASSTKEEVNSVQAAMIDKKAELKLLYVTPEKLAKSKRFMNKLEKMYEMGRFSRLVIDEVHCCSQWGHDFRPDYKFLGVMRRQFPGVPILGLTATATSTVITDVKKILGLSDCLIFKSSFNRTNLFYEVRPKPASLTSTMDDMQNLINKRFKNQSGIVYCFSRKDSEDVTRELQTRGIKAGCYHGDMDARHRSSVHQMWADNTIQVVVATVAFGMGIDKPNVRFVLHHSMSKSMENYYQESGRAGRDDEPAHCILYASFTDIFRQSTMVFTEQMGLEKLYTMVAYAYDAGTCRRALIAKHFGEQWNAAQCNKMCDHCKNEQECRKENVAPECRDIIRIIEHAQSTKQRVTALKVMDAWLGKGPTSLRISSVKCRNWPRSQSEQVLALMLLHGYLREDFHFTPYSTISYLLPGPRSNLLKSTDHEVLLPIAKSNTSFGKPKPKVTSTVTGPRQTIQKKDSAAKSVADSNSPSHNGSVAKTSYLGEQKRKKRPRVIDSDSDSDLDFCDNETKHPTLECKTSVSKQENRSFCPKKSRTLVSSQEDEDDCIVLDNS